MSIKMYINGTPGQKDGTEITSLTFKNIKKYMRGGDNCNQHNSCFSYIPIYLREEEGYTASNVTINAVYNEINSSVVYSRSSGPFENYSDYFRVDKSSLIIKKIGTTNVLVYVGVEYNTSVPAGTTLFNISYIEDPA